MKAERLPEACIPADLASFYADLSRRAGPGQWQAGYMRREHQRQKLQRLLALLDELYHQGARTCLEVACAEGYVTVFLADLFNRVEAIDLSPDFLAVCPELPNVRYYQADIEHWTPRHGYDVVLLSEILEHLKDPGAAVRKLAPRAKWIMACSPINEEPNPAAFDPALYGIEVACGDASGHVWSFDRAGFLGLFDGLDVVHDEISWPDCLVIARGTL